MDQETREIPGYPGYLANDKGQIISCRTEPPTILSPRLHRGYLHVNIKTGCGRQTRKKEPVHKLVLFAFHGPKPSKDMLCRHLNGNALDNRPDNLAWGTARENVEDAIKHGTASCLRRGEESNRSVLTEEQVLEIHRLVNDSSLSQEAIARKFGVSPRHVACIKHWKTWRHLFDTPGAG